MLSSIGDGAIKLNQAVPGYFNKENLRDLTGINYSSDAGETSSASTQEQQKAVVNPPDVLSE